MKLFSAMPKIKLFYICVAALIIILFSALLYYPMKTAFHETDLWWMIPTISHIIKVNSFFGSLKELFFNPHLTHSGEPLLNLFFFFILSCLGFQTKYFIFASMLTHFSSCVLLYFLIRKIGLNSYIAFFSALLYATMFIHFHGYFWPMPYQHLLIIFFTFLVLNLYLKTNEYIDRNSRWSIYFWLTLFVNFLASFCPFAILILPAAIFVHILFCAKDTHDRVRKYEIWLPLFITYLGNPLIRLCYAGSPVIGNYLHLEMQQVSNAIFFPVIFSFGIGILFLFGLVLILGDRYNYRRIFRYFIGMAISLYLVLYIAFSVKKGVLSPLHVRRIFLVDFLSPYNFIRPFVGIFVSFFAPFKIALAMNSAMAYYYIPLQGSIIGILLSLFMIFIFIKRFLFRYKSLIVFVVVYILALRNMWMMNPIPSRYFIYITPAFAVVFTSCFVYSYNILMDKARVKENVKKIILPLIFLFFCITNIFAIKIALFRGRLANTFFIFDYLEIAESVNFDIKAHNFIKGPRPEEIYINEPTLMPFKECWYFSPVDPLDFHTLRYTFAQVFDDNAMLNININKKLNSPGRDAFVYTINYARITDFLGNDIGQFAKDFGYAMKELELGNNEAALMAFQGAIKRRPFLLNYLLAGYRLEDLPWITGNVDLRTWMHNLASYYNSWKYAPVEKTIHVSRIIDNEIDRYLECLFYGAYLEEAFGRHQKSNAFLAQIKFLDDDYRKVSSWIAKRPLVSSNKEMSNFLNDTTGFGPLHRKGKRDFFKFILKLALNKEARKENN